MDQIFVVEGREYFEREVKSIRRRGSDEARDKYLKMPQVSESQSILSV